MNHEARLLLKIPCIVAICMAWQWNGTPPHLAKDEERIETDDLGERWLKAGNPYGLYRGMTFWAIGLIEIATILFGGDSRSKLDFDLLSMVGFCLVMMGTWWRYQCFSIMKENFVFDLAIRKDQNLVTQGPYSIVRHPAYTALAMIYTGLFIWYGSPGSWLRESTIPKILPVAAYLIFYGGYEISVLFCLLFSRTIAEDEQLKKTFGKQWDDWAQQTPYALIPGLW